MGYSRDAYGTECAALTRALGTAAGRRTTPENVTIFTDAQASIRRTASDEPLPGQMYAIQVRKHIATLRRAKPDIAIGIRWCPAHKGIPGNEKADGWAKLAVGGSWGGMEAVHRPVWQTTNAPSEVAGTSQAGDPRKEMAGSQGLGGFTCHWEEIPVLPTGKSVPETGPSSRKEQQAAGSQVLPVEGWSLSHWPVPPVDEEQAYGQVLVVPVLDCSRIVPAGRPGRRSCGRKRGRRRAEAKIGLRSETFLPMSGVVRRPLASSPPQMWGDGYQTRLRRIPRVRCRRGNLGNGKGRRRRGGQRKSRG